jgi:hypothetical protein
MTHPATCEASDLTRARLFPLNMTGRASWGPLSVGRVEASLAGSTPMRFRGKVIFVHQGMAGLAKHSEIVECMATPFAHGLSVMSVQRPAPRTAALASVSGFSEEASQCAVGDRGTFVALGFEAFLRVVLSGL